jgi:phosphatidylserine decarboxylase
LIALSTYASLRMGNPDAIEFFNRYTRRSERETVYGDAWLRWTYGNPLGRLALELVAKRALFSRWYGWRMNRPSSRVRVAPFIKQYGVDTSEFADPPESFRTFNEFFVRRLKPDARPIDADADSVVFPADGRHLGFQDVSQTDGVFVKGQRFDLPALLGDTNLAARYSQGTLVASRLCPVDYHRFHFPAAGTPGEPRLINGPLYSVNPIALRRRLAYLWENRRVITTLDTERFGQVLLLEIGATNVGSIVQTFAPGRAVKKGVEKGCFEFGGSSTITLFEPGRVKLADDLLEQTGQCRELYARMGDRMDRVG